MQKSICKLPENTLIFNKKIDTIYMLKDEFSCGKERLIMKLFCKIFLSILTALCVFKGLQLLIDFLYDKYGKRYIQSEEF